MSHTADLPLFAWQPSHQVILFPLVKRVGRIREVAARLVDKPTDRAATAYRNQVNDALLRSFFRAGIPEPEQHRQLGVFWQAVEIEVARCNRCDTPGGSAA